MLSFSTKAETLQLLSNCVTKSLILDQIYFTVKEWDTARENVISRVKSKFKEQYVIVRSSALSEDTARASQAGKYLSLLNIAPAAFPDAVNRVIAAFDDGCLDNQVLVQPMLKDIAMCGVLFTADPNTGGNYHVINYDETGSSDSITSGGTTDTNVHYVFKGCISGNKRLDCLIAAADEVTQLFGNDCVDIEFAFTRDNALYLLQARPLVLTKPVADYDTQKSALKRVFQLLKREMCPKPNVHGHSTVFGVMPDWNPAEMIGIRPKPLALSLYRRLITDGIWAYQRNNYGYKNLRSFPLMLDFCGLPYIDTRASFNSFIPKDIDEHLSAKLADYYIDALTQQPDKHDKVEFDIIFSCYTFDLPERIQKLEKYNFTLDEQKVLQDALRRLTNTIINTRDGLWIADAERIKLLQAQHETIVYSKLDTVSKIYWLLENCARYGTLPFAGLARAGFIAVLLLKSLVSIGVLSEQDYENYMGQLNTVSAQMSEDQSVLSSSAFLHKYGHLRPGTYDITSKRYDEAADLYFNGNRSRPTTRKKTSFALTLAQYAAIQGTMNQQGLEGDVLALFKFLKAGIEGREYAKFIFTRSLSDALELFAELGSTHGFGREDMAYVDCSIIDKLYSTTDDVQHLLKKTIAEGKRKYAQTLTFTMPPVISTPEDIYSFALPSGTPNYITLGNATGSVCFGIHEGTHLAGKILMIPAADPGYDWIFTSGIVGFITAYGGANSHMAIRAGELGIPAVIGVGEKLFSIWKSAKTLFIDCANKKVEILG